MPIYEFQCKTCDARWDEISKVISQSWKLVAKKAVYCPVCGKKTGYRAVSLFKLGKKLLETTGKSGYETDDLTLGKIIDEGGIPAEHKRKLRERDQMIGRQKQYTKELKERAKKYNFDPFESKPE